MYDSANKERPKHTGLANSASLIKSFSFSNFLSKDVTCYTSYGCLASQYRHDDSSNLSTSKTCLYNTVRFFPICTRNLKNTLEMLRDKSERVT